MCKLHQYEFIRSLHDVVKTCDFIKYKILVNPMNACKDHKGPADFHLMTASILSQQLVASSTEK